jgi:quinol monooxygenase YgiN
MIAVMIRLVAHPDTRDELVRRVREEMFAPTRREPGCIRYRFYQDIEDPNAFSFVEEWESWDTLTAHFRTDHVGRFLAGLGDVLAAPPEGGFHEVAASRGVNAIAEAREAASA